ncbi:MAG: phosphoribosylformylglycinamidine synthase I [Candidatus Omnitrophica bacterium]|nr:phosphoribosylformylglycinamidine synthase I [Candidatus Omnitrophota bacterium]
MASVRALILRTAGTNCDMETGHAFALAGAKPELIHINALIKEKSVLREFRILALPGGFSYGDDIASGKILANELVNTLRDEIRDFVRRGGLVIGICNGFQVLVKMGLLPDTSGNISGEVEATLALNDSGRFESRWVYLKKCVKGKKECVWTKGLPDVIHIPVAHGEGKFIPRDRKVLSDLNDNGQIVFRYVDKSGAEGGYPHNPNGSIEDIAGVSDPGGKILGLMPHPERNFTFLQDPNWFRSQKIIKDAGVGLQIFKNGVNFFK